MAKITNGLIKLLLFPPFVFVCGIYAIELWATLTTEAVVKWMARRMEA